MGKFPNSVFVYPFSTRYYLTHPWKWVQDFYCNCKAAWHRATRGFAYIDVWNMDTYLAGIVPEMLRYLANNSSGYPGREPWETPEKYSAALLDLASDFELLDYDKYLDTNNEYCDEYMDKILEPHHEPILHKFLEREEELGDAYELHKALTFQKLSEMWNTLWD